MVQIDSARLNEIAQQFGLDLIVLFGSHAKGRARPGSDVDIAVRAIQRPWDDWKWEFEVEAALSDAIQAEGEVDTVFLNGASPLLMFQVASTGQALFEKEWGVFSDFKSYAALRYYDDEPRRERQTDYLKSHYAREARNTQYEKNTVPTLDVQE